MKRIISLMLSLIIILSLVCGAVPAVSAASAMKTSDLGINMIKTFEGFHKYPQKDNTQWTIGYGTGIPESEVARYNASGITEAQAVALMKEYLVSFERSVNSFIDTNNLKLNQQQFDALVSFTYNLGPSWMNSGTFRSAVINGKKGNDFIYAMAQYGKSGATPLGGLIERRLCEANLYLNGVYSNTPPANYKYVIYQGGLEGVVPTVTIQGYDATYSSAIKATVAEKSGYRFLGWYTTETGGEWVTSVGPKTAATTKLYARWQNGEGPRNDDGSIKGTAASYSGYAASGESRSLYNAPNGKKIGTVKGDAKMTVSADYIDSNGKKWFKISGGWVTIASGMASAPVYEDSDSAINPIAVTVTTGGVNNRIGPGTNYAKNGTYSKGEKLVLTAIQKGGNYTWGKSEKGWIALQYTDYETSKLQNSADAKKVTAIGTIFRTNYVNVRAGAGVKHAKVGTYQRNDEVKISLRQKVGNIEWGLTEKGWVSLYYVKLTKVNPGDVADMNFSSGTTGGTTIGGITTGNGNGTTVISSGKIYNCKTLRIRAAAGTSHAHVGDYESGTFVNIYETTTVGSQIWGRTDKGWISMRYVKLDAPTTGAGVTGRVFRTNTVNVRSGAGTHFPKVASLAKGTKVEIFEYTKVGNATWGRTAQGWVSLYYVSLDAPLSNLDKVVVDSTPAVTEPTVTEPTVTQPAATKYDITIATAANGVVTASATEAAKDTEVTLTINPNTNYVLNTLSVKTANGTDVAVTNNKFTMPEGDVTVTATFKVQYNVKIQNATGGKVTANTIACDAGTQILLTVTPDAGQALKTLSIVNTATNAVTELYNEATDESAKNAFTMPAADVNVVATFKSSTGTAYAVKVNAAANGEVAANVSTAKKNETVMVVVNPDADYILDELTVRDSSNKLIDVTPVAGAKNTYKFAMPDKNVTVNASFKREKFEVTISKATGGAVTIAEPGTYKNGDIVTLSVAASNEYKFKKLEVLNGKTPVETKQDGSTFTFKMPAANVTVKATFEKIQYNLTIKESANGAVEAGAKTYAKGDDVTLTIKPATGYELDKLTVKDADGKAVTVTDNKFDMPTKGATVEATFKLRVYKVNFELYENNAKIDPVAGVHMSASKTDAVMGETITLNVYGDTGYRVSFKSILDDAGKPVEVASGMFTMPASNVNVAVNVERTPYDVNVARGIQGGTVELKEVRQYKVGETVKVKVTPYQDFRTRYALQALTVTANGNAVAAEKVGEYYEFTMPASNVDVTATFKRVYAVNTSGGVTANPANAATGEEVTLTVPTREGFAAVVTVKDFRNNDVAVADNKFTMPEGGVTVTVTYKRIREVKVGNLTNGKITVSANSATAGETVTVTVTPDKGYMLWMGLNINNGSVFATPVSGKANTYTFTMPDADVNITAMFVPRMG